MKGNTLSRKRSAVAARLAAVLCALAVGVAATPAASALVTTALAAAPVGSATALSATGVLEVDPLASLAGGTGFRQTSAAEVALPLPTTPVLTAGALNAEVDAGRARSSAVDVRTRLELVGLPFDLSAELVEARCDDGAGGVTLAGARIAGHEVALRPAPGTGVAVPGVASVVLNDQRRNGDGSLTVTAVVVEAANLQRIEIASATCARGAAEEQTPTPSATPTPSDAPATTTTRVAGPSASSGGPAKAPRPTPVAGHLAVTG
ncbi:choice-of-anchor P family protein [Saccharothrix yanglingensis]|uniref:Secreted protein n=1 Tax=Saccharothrix yanglingensis TaxID=659496 RepID=A0ABU0WRU4_9PSEU|nr:choice-of-anchor P family protein [Saccharothrix yanglingensis]MDQ2582568.1 hypothetical protein [Saccharothrix yanglingensis]